MTLFKVKYKKGDTEIEVEVNLPSLDKVLAANELGIAPTQIISIRKK